MVYLSDNHPGGDRAWGSFSNFIQLLDDGAITRPLIRVRSILQEACYYFIQSREIDYNRDGRVDVFNFTLEFQLADNQNVYGIRFLAFFDVRLHVCVTKHAFKFLMLIFHTDILTSPDADSCIHQYVLVNSMF